MRPLKQLFQPLFARLTASRSCDEVLRVGRHSLQRWTVANIEGAKNTAGTAMLLQASADLPADAWGSSSWPGAALSAALAQLYPSAPDSGVEVVLESTWLPVMLAQTGGVLVSEAQAAALLRHRLAQWYEGPDDPVALWDVRVSFNPGDMLALGFGLSPQVSNALNQAASQLGFRITALTPAWAWGWQRAQVARVFESSVTNKARWWGWQEQDRLLLGLVEGEGTAAQVKSLHTGLGWSDDPQYLAQTVRSEAQRLGLVDVPQDICIGTWTPQGCCFIKHSRKITP